MTDTPRQVNAVFPNDVRSVEVIREFVDTALGEAASGGAFPVWRLPEASSRTSEYLRWRRAILLFLLRMPGRVDLDIDVERELQSAEAAHPFDVDEVLRRCMEASWFGVVHADVNPNEVYVAWQDLFVDEPQVVVAEPRVRGNGMWGAFVIANLSDESCYAGDGSVVVASDWPFASPEDSPADQWFDESLPAAMTTIWFAAK